MCRAHPARTGRLLWNYWITEPDVRTRRQRSTRSHIVVWYVYSVDASTSEVCIILMYTYNSPFHRVIVRVSFTSNNNLSAGSDKNIFEAFNIRKHQLRSFICSHPAREGYNRPVWIKPYSGRAFYKINHAQLCGRVSRLYFRGIDLRCPSQFRRISSPCRYFLVKQRLH